jgi:hypothetical protein
VPNKDPGTDGRARPGSSRGIKKQFKEESHMDQHQDQLVNKKQAFHKVNVSPIRQKESAVLNTNSTEHSSLEKREESMACMQTCKRGQQDIIFELDDETSMTPASSRLGHDRDKSFEKEGGQRDEQPTISKQSTKRQKNGNNITNKELKKEITKFMNKIDHDKSQTMKQTVKTPGFKTQKTFSKSPAKMQEAQSPLHKVDLSGMSTAQLNASGVDESAAGHIDSLKTQLMVMERKLKNQTN